MNFTLAFFHLQENADFSLGKSARTRVAFGQCLLGPRYIASVLARHRHPTPRHGFLSAWSHPMGSFLHDFPTGVHPWGAVGDDSSAEPPGTQVGDLGGGPGS